MSLSAISAVNSSRQASSLIALQSAQAATGVKTSKSADSSRDPAAIKKAAAQFEAIILRQLLEPTIGPVMSGGLGGGSGSDSAAGNIYGYMLTDSLANSMAQAGGLGLGSMLVKQFTPHGVSTDKQGGGTTSAQPSTFPTKMP